MHERKRLWMIVPAVLACWQPAKAVTARQYLKIKAWQCTIEASEEGDSGHDRSDRNDA